MSRREESGPEKVHMLLCYRNEETKKFDYYDYEVITWEPKVKTDGSSRLTESFFLLFFLKQSVVHPNDLRMVTLRILQFTTQTLRYHLMRNSYRHNTVMLIRPSQMWFWRKVLEVHFISGPETVFQKPHSLGGFGMTPNVTNINQRTSWHLVSWTW